MSTSVSSPVSLSAPIYQNQNKISILSPLQLPLTPTSSISSSSLEKNKATIQKMSSLQISASQQYGSLGSSAPYSESLIGSTPNTPSHTTISSNENDEGLYLLWTQQLLREQGFKPSSCRQDEVEYTKAEENDDDDDSSVTDMSSISSGEEDDGEIDADHYIAEQLKLFSSSGPSSSYAYSHRASMYSRYSSIDAAVETMQHIKNNDNTLDTASSENPTVTFFRSCFPSCF